MLVSARALTVLVTASIGRRNSTGIRRVRTAYALHFFLNGLLGSRREPRSTTGTCTVRDKPSGRFLRSALILDEP
jgi:hypothetical protein